MTIKQFNNLEEIKKYYNEESNTYVFKEDGDYIHMVVFNFDLNVQANISALHIYAYNIHAWNIDAINIDARYIDAINIEVNNIIARDIKAEHISYYAVCFVYNNIKCKSIEGRRENAKHFVLDGKIEIEQ